MKAFLTKSFHFFLPKYIKFHKKTLKTIGAFVKTSKLNSKHAVLSKIVTENN